MPQALHHWSVCQATGFSACTCLGCPSAGGQSTTGSARKELRSCMFERVARQVAPMKPPLSRNRRRRKRRFIGRSLHSCCIVAHQGLTHRSSGQSKGCAFCLPLTSNVRRQQTTPCWVVTNLPPVGALIPLRLPTGAIPKVAKHAIGENALVPTRPSRALGATDPRRYSLRARNVPAGFASLNVREPLRRVTHRCHCILPLRSP